MFFVWFNFLNLWHSAIITIFYNVDFFIPILEEDNGLSTGVIIGIVIGVFFLLFIIVDLTCYFKNKCGILMSIREKVGGGREEGYAVAKTEDVENLWEFGQFQLTL